MWGGGGGGDSCVTSLNFKWSCVGALLVFPVTVGNERKCKERMLFVAVSLNMLSLLFRPCCLLEFTLAEPP